MRQRLVNLALGAALGGAAAWGAPHLLSRAAASPSQPLALFQAVLDKVDATYVDAVDDEKLVRSAVNAMLASLDPHSAYLDPKTLEEFQQSMKGEQFGGLGLEVLQESEAIRVVSPIDDTPAARAGMRSGDLIIQIDDTPTKDLTLKQAVDRMRGTPETSVTLKVLRGPAKETLDFTIVREIIHVEPVRSRLEANDIGYIRITQFGEHAFDGVKKAVAKFDASPGRDHIKGFIIDLRNDPGGLLTQAIEVTNAFVDKGVIVSTRGRLADQQQTYSARPGVDIADGKPVVVLINGGSASASEIVSGALQDLKRATLIGTRSFGKGSVQTILPLGENGALKLTTARYYTPSGRSIQAKGIEPDLEVLEDVPDDLKGKDSTLGEASLRGHLKNGDDEKTGSQAYVPPDPKDDKQLIAAIDLIHGTRTPVSTAGEGLPAPNVGASEPSAAHN